MAKPKYKWTVREAAGTGGWVVYRDESPHSGVYKDRGTAESLRADYERRDGANEEREAKKEKKK